VVVAELRHDNALAGGRVDKVAQMSEVPVLGFEGIRPYDTKRALKLIKESTVH
jgi:hypothetical protein